MDSLPRDLLKQHVAAYLRPTDLCRLGATSKSNAQALSLSTLPPRKILNQFSRTDYRNRFANADHGPYAMEYGFEIPRVPACHSVYLSMIWRDQGWGKRKGHFAIVASDTCTGGRTGHVVFASGFAPHSLESLYVTFAAKPDHTYHVYYVVGGGGGHSLNLYEVTVRALVFDDPARSLLKAHRCLEKGKIFLTWDVAQALASSGHSCHDTVEAILASTSHLLENGGEIPPPMLLFFRNCGISEAYLSLALVDSIRLILKDLHRELLFYGRCCANFEYNSLNQHFAEQV